MKLTKDIFRKFYVPGDPDGSWVELVHLKINQVKKLEAKANDMAFLGDGQGEGEVRVGFDPYNRSVLFAHASLHDWGGMNDVMGAPMEFNKANITKAAEFVVTIDGEDFDFYGWIDKCRIEFDADVRKELKAAEEN